jgi:hypothetical protein
VQVNACVKAKSRPERHEAVLSARAMATQPVRSTRYGVRSTRRGALEKD